jgi:hypothetical protein
VSCFGRRRAGLLASTGWLLTAEFKEKSRRVERKVAFERTMAAELGKIRSSATGSFKSNDRRVLTETSLLGGVKYKPKEESRPAVVAEVKPVNPIEEMVKIMAIRCSPDAAESSVALAPKAAGVTITERQVFTVGETDPVRRRRRDQVHSRTRGGVRTRGQDHRASLQRSAAGNRCGRSLRGEARRDSARR